MGNVGSRPDDPTTLYLKDQNRFTLSALTITNSRGAVVLNITPNAFPAARVTARRESGDDVPIEYIQDPDSPPTNAPSFLLRLSNEDELNFHFTFVIRQIQLPNSTATTTTVNNGVTSTLPEVADTVINGLTFAHASNAKELANLVTREFHANPNLQNNSNVVHVGNFATAGAPSVQFDWTWQWKPPKQAEDKGGGWRDCCSFLDYDQRTNRLNTIATFTFWVQNDAKRNHNTTTTTATTTNTTTNNNNYNNLASLSPGVTATPGFELAVPPSRSRMVSAQSSLSRASDADSQPELAVTPSSPTETTDGWSSSQQQQQSYLQSAQQQTTSAKQQPAAAPPVKVDITCQRPGEDMSVEEDGPLFRATMKALEQKTGNMRAKMKKVLKKAEGVHQAQAASNEAVNGFISALNEAATSNANAIQPALEHYFDKIAREILLYEQLNTQNLQKLVIEPLSKLYNNDIKQAESKKKDFDDESRDYYAFVGRYLGQRQDSLKEKKRVESDSKYQNKRRNFELRRFDYSTFMQDLHGGRKEQEVLSHLTKFASTQAHNYLSTAKKIEEMVPQLDALKHEVAQADKEYQFQRTEREEKRRTLEKSKTEYVEPETVTNPGQPPATPGNTTGGGQQASDSEIGRADSTSSQIKGVVSNTSTATSAGGASENRLKGIRDLEGRDPATGTDRQHKKEGLLWALSRPGSHIDPKGINKQAWHKFWIVLDQGKLSEYSNWKQKLDLHMDPIDLRMASVREARNTERRFCFEVITPQFKRIYQATSEEDMGNWITAINNALQSAVEGRMHQPAIPPSPVTEGGSGHKNIASVLTGKSSSHSGYSNPSAAANSVNRRTTVGARPSYVRSDSHSYDADPSKLLQVIRDADQGNNYCADCGSASKVEWVSINLGIVLCIECSGIHRSLGTHITKVRSLTLDTHSFSNDIVEILLQVGNRVSNMVWEARLDPPSLKPTIQSSREQRLKFITAKYSERAYVQPLSSTLSRFPTADETLVASIKRNDIQGVLHGIALRANLNVTDRSRNTHAVFLALAAADPAAPSSSTSRPSSATSHPQQQQQPPATNVKAIPFPVAELLVQNGAEIPTQWPAIPLSPAAQLYVNQRTGRVNNQPPPPPTSPNSNSGAAGGGGEADADKSSTTPNNPPGTGTAAAGAGAGSGGDRLSALPSIRGNEGSGMGSSGSGNMGVDNKERERLQKRGSAGARLAGRVASTLGSS